MGHPTEVPTTFFLDFRALTTVQLQFYVHVAVDHWVVEGMIGTSSIIRRADDSAPVIMGTQ